MMLAAPEFVVAERVELLDQIEVPAELQHRMLADRVMRGEEGSEFEARHGFLSGFYFAWVGSQTTGRGRPRQSRKRAIDAWLSCKLRVSSRPDRPFPQG